MSRGDGWILTAESPGHAAAHMGGKAANLRILTRHGLPVPRWFCLSAEAFDATLADALARGAPAAEVAKVFTGLRLPAPIEQAVARAVADLAPSGSLAVRSSAIGEDNAAASWAGMFDTFLHVPPGDVPGKIISCWASACGDRALAYLRRTRGDPARMRMAVVVQEMVDSAASGVLFTANPAGGRDEQVIVAGYGLGEGVVSGRVETDTYIIERDTALVRPDIVHKRRMIVRDSGKGRGTVEHEVPSELAQRPVLAPAQIAALVTLGERIGRCYGSEQDIEWAVTAGDAYWITQCRPITTRGGERKLVYDNSNIVEGYPGITLPLTFSLARRGYEEIFTHLLRRFGVSLARVRERAAELRAMIGYLEGRIYYNLSSWYRVFGLLPFSRRFRPVWDEMMGMSSPSFPLPRGSKQLGLTLRRLPSAACAVLVFLSNLVFLDRRMGRLRRRFRARYTEFWRRDMGADDAWRLIEQFEEMQRAVNDGWELTLFNDLYAMVFSALTRRLVARRKGAVDDDRDLSHALFCGDTGMESAEPVYSMLGMAEQIRNRPDVRAQLEEAAAEAEFSMPASVGTALPKFAEAFERHLALWGDRAPGELKLETRVFRQEPRALVRTVLGYVPTPLTVQGLLEKERGIRASAESKVGRAFLLRCSLWLARRSIRYRESARLDRARAFGIARGLFLEIGNRLVKAGLLSSQRDVFYLTTDEVAAVVRGTAVAQDTAELVERRQAQFARYAERRPRARVEVRGIPYAGPVAQEAIAAGPDGRRLAGTGCAPGIATGEALVVMHPDAALDATGRILITETTDPAWAFLMVSAAGLVAERGSLLSHTAIIGRELGIPTVVGVAGATRLIPGGARLQVNGGTGEITLLA